MYVVFYLLSIVLETDDESFRNHQKISPFYLFFSTLQNPFDIIAKILSKSS